MESSGNFAGVEKQRIFSTLSKTSNGKLSILCQNGKIQVRDFLKWLQNSKNSELQKSGSLMNQCVKINPFFRQKNFFWVKAISFPELIIKQRKLQCFAIIYKIYIELWNGLIFMYWYNVEKMSSKIDYSLSKTG